jgi:hypothetical protein
MGRDRQPRARPKLARQGRPLAPGRPAQPRPRVLSFAEAAGGRLRGFAVAAECPPCRPGADGANSRRQLPTRYTFAFEPGFEPVPYKDEAASDHQPDLPLSPEPTPEIGVGIDTGKAAEPTPISEPSRLRLAGVDIAEPVRLEPVSCVSDDGGADLDRAFAEFWNVHPRPKDRDACLQLFRQAVQAGEDANAIIDGARSYAKEQAGNRTMYVCQSDNWLKGSRWREGATSAENREGEVDTLVDFWAAKLRDGRYVPASAISPALAREMLRLGVVKQEDLERAGVQA